MPEAKVLGQLLLMQDILINLPDNKSIFSFVCKGLHDIPGVESVKYTKDSTDFKKKSAHIFYFGSKEKQYGAIQIALSDPDLFKKYEDYVRNFFFMVEVILEDHHQKHLINLHQSELEKKVEERTEQLKKEIDFRSKAEELTKQSEKKYRSLFENMTTGFALHEMLFDDQGECKDYRFLEVNPAFEKLTGLSSKDVIGKNIREVLPDIEHYWIETYCEVIKSGKPVAYQNYVKNIGRYFDTWTFKMDGNIFAVIFNDVTERVKAEKELEENKQKLQEQNEEYEALNEELNERNKELFDAKEKAEDSDRLKTAFLQNMSHEIRTPMNAIHGFAGMLDRTNISEEKRNSFISIIQSSSKQLLSIISDILSISSIETKQEKLHIEPVCINDILIELLAVFKESARNNNLSIYADQFLSDEESTISTDKIKLTQVLNNLISNSIKYTDEGYIYFGYKLKEDHLEFYVKDTGKGIKTKFQDKIFERFNRAEIDTKNLVSGTGLGLAISKGFVELLGGKIWVKSEHKKGSIFYFTIPYNSLSTDKITIPKKKEKQAAAKTILVAEDEEFNYLFIEEALGNSEFNILHAKNGREAIEVCKNNSAIDLILMDIKMPELDGYSAAKVIRDFRPELNIIAQSAYALEDEIENYKDIFDDYITKPIDLEELKIKVKSYS